MRLRPLRLRTLRVLITAAVPLALAALWLAAPASFTHTASAQIPANTLRNFESPQVHPLAVTPDGTRLLAVNSPNATLSVFQLTSGAPVLTAEIPVGLEPVSVAARSDREAWVVNWLSDSVSIVDLATGNVTRTIDVGDEPTDVLFAGPNRGLAFVCVSGGGKMSVSDISVTGASGAVKVFDASNLSAAPTVIEIFGKQPRALESNATGERVFVSVFESGNQTTVVPEPVTRVNGGLPPPVPAMAAGLPAAPNTGLVVRWNGAAWADESGNTKWDPFVTYTLADVDLVTINAVGNPAAAVAVTRGLGTHLGNMAFDPATGRLYVVNLESDSVRRFEPNLRGTFQANRVSALDTSGGAPALAFARDLNPHVNFSNPAGTDDERALSLALPGDIERASDGTLYVTAVSSAKVGVLDALGNVSARVNVGNGPTGLALDEPRQRLYVLNRHDQTVSVVNTASNTQASSVPVGHNPEQAVVRNGRRFLYDAANFSAHGTVSCASCHPTGHRDGLAWDLGDPTGALVTVSGTTHHPMKGPMTTQSLRGLFAATPLHWRADRTDVTQFNAAFTGLLGSKRLLTAQEMAQFVAFVNTLSYPPNPNENADRTFPNPPTGPNADTGSKRFRLGAGFPTLTLGGVAGCNTCHQALTNIAHNFLMGSDRVTFPGSIFPEPQAFKVPQLRGMYQKAGMLKPAAGQPRTEQLTGFGFGHDGTFDTTVSFMRQPGFTGFNNDAERRDIEAFLLSFDSVLAPAVGMQVAVTAENKNSPDVLARLDVLVQQSQRVTNPGGFLSGPGCDLVVRGIYGGRVRGFFRQQDGTFLPDSNSEARVTLQQLLDAAGPGSELTFTGVPPGEGRRFSTDRDNDLILDDDEPRSSVRIEGRVVTPDGLGIAGVAVDLSGSQSASAVTDESGRYVFNFLSTSGTHTVTPRGQAGAFAPASATFAQPTWDRSATFIASQTANASDASRFFVEQQYRDFLNREPDAPGLAHWINEIESCGADLQCREVRRINVSAAFFQSIEFQESAFLAYRTYKATFGDAPGRPVPLTFPQLMSDGQRLSRNVVVGQGAWQAQIAANKDAFFLGWVQRPEFFARFPVGMSGPDFAAALNNNAGGVLTQAEFNTLVDLVFNNNTLAARAAAVRFVAENAELARRETNRAFVLMQYHGYLRRDPNEAPEQNLDFTGYNHWLGKLNEFNGNFVEAEMVKAFLSSTEYRQRFGKP